MNYGEFYKDYLTESVAPFWITHGLDRENGGIYTCLERDGTVYSDEKSVWFQGRAAWFFSKMYNCIEKKREYLEAAESCIEFLKKCYDTDGRMFFEVTKDARPIRKRRYYFSETFAAIAFAEYYKATGDAEALKLSRETFALIDKLYHNPELTEPKYYKVNFNVKAYAVPMILLSTAQVMRSCDGERVDYYNAFITEMLTELFTSGYYNEQKRAMTEFISADRSVISGPKSRLVNPGHAIEGAWFIMAEALYRKDDDMLRKALNILDWSLEIGWDMEYGGLYSFIDLEGKPPEQLEWDMKLWWPQTEGVIANLLAWKITRDEKYKSWFEKFHNYSFNSFCDNVYGEWYGYLHRDGSVSTTLKGNLFKGPYHMPRMLILAHEILSDKPVELSVLGMKV